MPASVFYLEQPVPRTHDTKRITINKGPLIVNVEPIFIHFQRYPKRRVAPARPPLTEVARARELDDPWRNGHGRIVRLWPTRRAVVVGYWEPAGEPVTSDEESERLEAAVEGAMIPEITASDIGQWAKPRDVPSGLRRVLAWLEDRFFGVVVRDLRAQEAVAEPTPDYGGVTVTEWDDTAPVIDIEQARSAGGGRPMWDAQ